LSFILTYQYPAIASEMRNSIYVLEKKKVFIRKETDRLRIFFLLK